MLVFLVLLVARWCLCRLSPLFVAPVRLGSLPFVVRVVRLRCGVGFVSLLRCLLRLRSFGGLVSCASGVSVFGSVAAGVLRGGVLVRLAVALAVGLCRALASSVWSLRCPFAVASCSVCGGLRVSARCVSSVGSVRSGVSLPLSGGGIAVRSERLLSRPLLSSLCVGGAVLR